MQNTVKHCKTLAKHCKTLQNTAKHCKNHAKHCKTLENTAPGGPQQVSGGSHKGVLLAGWLGWGCSSYLKICCWESKCDFQIKSIQKLF